MIITRPARDLLRSSAVHLALTVLFFRCGRVEGLRLLRTLAMKYRTTSDPVKARQRRDVGEQHRRE